MYIWLSVNIAIGNYSKIILHNILKKIITLHSRTFLIYIDGTYYV